MGDLDELLRRLAIADRDGLDRLLGADLSPEGVPGLDARTCALVRLAGLVGLGATGTACQWAVGEAIAAGTTDDAVAGTLVALLPVAGTVRVSAATTDVALALGWDIDANGRLIRPGTVDD